MSTTQIREQPIDDFSITIPLTEEERDIADIFAVTQPNPEAAERVRCNTLSVIAVAFYLDLHQIETDITSAQLWNRKQRQTQDIADLPLPGIGWIECRAFSPDQTEIRLPPHPNPQRIGYVGVELNPDTPETAKLLGFVAHSDSTTPLETLHREQLGSLDNLLDVLTRLELLGAILAARDDSPLPETLRQRAITELQRVYAASPHEPWEWAGLAEQRLFDDTLTRNSKDLMVTKNRETPTQSDPDKHRLQQRSFLESVLEEMDEQWRKLSE
ncbi:DUF1822 family protein [Laspinema palackyanum]|uniref:DUF1822 family protein n=1 Tax=Laspinema palackyanum TaxID=3231601 RepID=UPI00345D744C|nr:DUF1822 family protein [Laspinema sp. D2c]